MLAREGQDVGAARPAERVRQAQVQVVPDAQDEGFQEGTALPSRPGQGGTQPFPEPGPELRPSGYEAPPLEVPGPGEEDPSGSPPVRNEPPPHPDPGSPGDGRAGTVQDHGQPPSRGSPDSGTRSRGPEGQDQPMPA